MVYKFFDEKTCDGTGENEIIFNKELAKKKCKNQLLENLRKEDYTFYRQYLGCRSSRYAIDK